QLGTGYLDLQVLGTRGVSSDVRQVDIGLLAGGQLDLGFLGRFLQTLQRQRIVVQVNAVFLLELVCQIVDQTHVEVFTTEEGRSEERRVGKECVCWWSSEQQIEKMWQEGGIDQ